MLSIFFLSGALVTTGVSDAIGSWVRRSLGTREPVLVTAIMLTAGVMSAFMNNIAATAVLCVVEHPMTGIGGDCFALISKPGQKPIGLNASGRAPGALTTR